MRQHTNANPWRFSYGLALPLSLLAGCGQYAPGPGKLDSRRDAVLAAYFTEEAEEILRVVPLNEGTVNRAAGFAVGDDWGSQLASWVYGYGAFRQVLIAPSADECTIFHEYVHQADYSGLIDRQEFNTRVEQLRAEVGYRAIVEKAEAVIRDAHSGDFLSELALAYNDGLTRELIANLIVGYVRGDYDLPEYFLEVYSRALRLGANESCRS